MPVLNHLPHDPMHISRLRQQGFTNLHRKTLFGLLAAALAGYLIFVRDPLPLDAAPVACAWFAGAALVFLGIIGRVFATLSIGGNKDRGIARTELCSVCRNPLYFSPFLMARGRGLVSGRMDFALLCAGAYLAIFYPMMRNEARFLRGKFEDYADYEKRVPLFFPDFRLWSERKHFEINFKLARRTLLDASVALPFVPIMIVIGMLRR